MKKYLTMLMLALGMLLFIPGQAEAKAKLTTLKDNKTYKIADVNHDGKKDKIKIKTTKTYSKNMTTERKVYINGKYKFTATGCKGVDVYLYQNGTKGVFVEVFHYGDTAEDVNVRNYTSGKYKKKNLINTCCFNARVKVKNDNLYVYSSPKGFWWLNSFRNNYDGKVFEYRDTYTLSKWTLKKRNTYPAVVGNTTFYSKSTVVTSTSPKKMNSNGPKMKAGQKITLKYYYYDKKNYANYFGIKIGDKIGWIEDSEYVQFYQ